MQQLNSFVVDYAQVPVMSRRRPPCAKSGPPRTRKKYLNYLYSITNKIDKKVIFIVKYYFKLKKTYFMNKITQKTEISNTPITALPGELLSKITAFACAPQLASVSKTFRALHAETFSDLAILYRNSATLRPFVDRVERGAVLPIPAKELVQKVSEIVCTEALQYSANNQGASLACSIAPAQLEEIVEWTREQRAGEALYAIVNALATDGIRAARRLLPSLNSRNRGDCAQQIRAWMNQEDITLLLTEIAALSLKDRNLRYIPPEIARFTNLLHLNLSENQLSTLPTELSTLASLRTLTISNNPQLSVPAEITRSLPNLIIIRENGAHRGAIPVVVRDLAAPVEIRREDESCCVIS
jgi:Leucine-rich repeat (LRR) protein